LLIIAHRGDSAHRPENTLASFASALEVGASLVEFDVQLTRDGEVVVLHDPTVDRTTDGTGQLSDLTLKELRGLSAGYRARFSDRYAEERVPTLSEALDFLRGQAKVMIEIKAESVTDQATEGVEAKTIAEVRRLGMSEDVALISFDHRSLLRCRDLAPEIARGHLFSSASLEEALQACHDAQCLVMMPEKHLLNEQLASRARAEGLLVATWVVDDPAELSRLVRLGLYGIGSNRPGVLLEALAESQASTAPKA
jgi:glycerophosphoryl diester phosphodiesterase